MKFKLAVNSSILDKKPSGLGIYTKNVIKELNKIDKQLLVYSPVEIDGVKTERINKYVKPEYKKKGGIIRVLWTQLILPFKVPKNYVIYHPFQYISLFSRRKQIITIHDFIPLYYPEVAKHQNLYYRYLMPILLKKAYKVICISENTKNDLMKFYNVDEGKIKVIYNGYDKKLYNKKNLKKSTLKKYNINYNYMIMVGAGYKHKNLHRVISAFRDIKNTEIKLVIVGKESSYIKELKDLVKAYNIEERVEFIGYVPDEDLISLYGYAECFIYPSLYEGFGLPILEAMASGTAVLCGNNSSLLEVAKGGALTFNSENIEEIRGSIERFLNEKGLREELIKKSEKVVKEFSWEKTAREIYDFINE